jgi:hypothetical protein
MFNLLGPPPTCWALPPISSLGPLGTAHSLPILATKTQANKERTARDELLASSSAVSFHLTCPSRQPSPCMMHMQVGPTAPFLPEVFQKPSGTSVPHYVPTSKGSKTPAVQSLLVCVVLLQHVWMVNTEKRWETTLRSGRVNGQKGP